MKSFLIILFFFSISNASMLLDKKNCCIEDYYVSNARFYYLKTRTGNWNSTTTSSYSGSVLYGYDYNSSDDSCRQNSINKVASSLGLSYISFNMLMALSAVLFSSILVFFLTAFLVSF